MDWCRLNFPSSRGIKTAQYTLALYIDRDTKQLKKSLLFDDVKDPYQLHNLPLEENKEIVAQLCGEMGAMLKEIMSLVYGKDSVGQDSLLTIYVFLYNHLGTDHADSRSLVLSLLQSNRVHPCNPCLKKITIQ